MLPVEIAEATYLIAFREVQEASLRLILCRSSKGPLVKIFNEKMEGLNEAKKLLAQTPSTLLEELERSRLICVEGLPYSKRV
jgi:hypothetical protein